MSAPAGGAPGGPLEGCRIVELGGLGPAPYAAMLLAEAGAEVLRLERASAARARPESLAGTDTLAGRSRASLGIDLKHPGAAAFVLDLAGRADAVIEGFRPGVAERLGVGPEQCGERNERLVYGRVTGWGQDGPLAQAVGHDIDYLALSGALWCIGRSGGAPVPPVNFLGDFGAGGMLLAFGVTAALYEAQRSGRGQVVDAAMVDGAASFLTMVFGMWQAGQWTERRGENLLDTGAPFYDVYETADGKHVAVGAIEPRFYGALLEGLGIPASERVAQMERERWPELRERFAAAFLTRTRDEWVAVFEGTEACVAPVLSPWEAPNHAHLAARSTFVTHGGTLQPGAVPRFTRTPSRVREVPPVTQVLEGWGLRAGALEELRAAGVIAPPQ